MNKLFLDIETLPGDESLRRRIEAEISPPRTYSRPERIKQWEEEEKADAIDREYRATALKGHSGRILCIGYIKEGPEGKQEGVISGEEQAILRDFWELAADVDLFVGFNVLDFDLKYLWQRSVVQGVLPSKDISFFHSRNDQVYDVMVEWDRGGREKIKLDTLTRTLGIVSPKEGGMAGDKVYPAYLEGRLQEIYDYCLADVVATREVYRRMNFL